MRRHFALTILIAALTVTYTLTFAATALLAQSGTIDRRSTQTGTRQVSGDAEAATGARASGSTAQGPGGAGGRDAGGPSGTQVGGATHGQPAANKNPPADATPGAPSQPLRAYWDVAKTHSFGLFWILVAVAVLAGGAGILLGGATQPGPEPLILRLTPSFFFWLGMTYAALLLLIAVFFNLTKDPAAGATVVGGVLPVAVPWFGALGGVTISLEGVFLWNAQWDRSFNYWHIGRPVFGAVLGIVAFFLFVVIVSAAGSAPKFLDGGSAAAKDYIIFYVVAFLVGYREATFRDLIKRATDLILKPSPPASPAPAVTFKLGGAAVSKIDCPTAAIGDQSECTVEILNTGNAQLTAPAVKLSTATGSDDAVFTIVNDRVTGKGDLAVGAARSVDVQFKPSAKGPLEATLTVTGTNLTTPKTIRVTGKTA